MKTGYFISKKSISAAIIGAVVFLCASCQPVELPAEGTALPEVVETDVLLPTETPEPSVSLPAEPVEKGDAPYPLTTSFTYHHADGNRLISGRGAVPNVAPIDIALDGTPVWVIAGPASEGSLWVVVLESGVVQAFQVRGRNAEPVEAAPYEVSSEMPPFLISFMDAPALAVPPTNSGSQISSPILLPESSTLAYLEENGDLIVKNVVNEYRLELNALPDARLLYDDDERILLLADATTRYAHGVLGDAVEAASIKLVDIEPVPQVVHTIPIDPPAVVEGTAPIWTDIDGDGVREIVVTVSDSAKGARLVVFDEKGNQIASGPSIGQGNRWRHQIAVGPFGPDGEIELVDVLTPHLGRVVEFFRLEGDELRLASQVDGLTSHVIGSRNLDQAAAGDFDGDGNLEVLLMAPDQLSFGAVRHTDAGAEVVWTVPAGGKITTNLGAFTLNDGSMIVGAGTAENILRIWAP